MAFQQPNALSNTLHDATVSAASSTPVDTTVAAATAGEASPSAPADVHADSHGHTVSILSTVTHTRELSDKEFNEMIENDIYHIAYMFKKVIEDLRDQIDQRKCYPILQEILILQDAIVNLMDACSGEGSMKGKAATNYSFLAHPIERPPTKQEEEAAEALWDLSKRFIEDVEFEAGKLISADPSAATLQVCVRNAAHAADDMVMCVSGCRFEDARNKRKNCW